jgi:hypothetical protein
MIPPLSIIFPSGQYPPFGEFLPLHYRPPFPLVYSSLDYNGALVSIDNIFHYWGVFSGWGRGPKTPERPVGESNVVAKDKLKENGLAE